MIIKMIIKGFRFGMLLQFAIGPMCIMVFQTSARYGILYGLILVLAISIIDAFYISLSGLGVAAFINKRKIRRVIQVFGCVVLVLFGLNTILEVFQFSIFPTMNVFSNVTSQNVFIQGLLLTASNPLTIIFWSGVFSTQVIENNLDKKQIILFGMGCVFSTLLFLTTVSVFGSIISGFLPLTIIHILNVMVGILLIFFGLRLLLRK